MISMVMKSKDSFNIEEFNTYLFSTFSDESKDEPMSPLPKIDQTYSEASKPDEILSDQNTVEDQNIEIITNDPNVSTLCVCRLCGIEAKTKG